MEILLMNSLSNSEINYESGNWGAAVSLAWICFTWKIYGNLNISLNELAKINGLNFVNRFALLYSTKTDMLETSDVVSIRSDHTINHC